MAATVAAEQALLRSAGQVQDRFVKRLRRDRARVHRSAAHDAILSHDDNPLAELRCLDGGLLLCGPGTADGQIEVFMPDLPPDLGFTSRIGSPSSTASVTGIRVRPATGFDVLIGSWSSKAKPPQISFLSQDIACGSATTT